MLVKYIMDKYEYNEGSGIFIQVGAGAGDLDTRANCRDGFTEFIKKLPRNRINQIILVEPNPLNIPKLRECWKDYPEAVIYEYAIIPKSIAREPLDLYYCPDDAPHYQVASINKSHIQKNYGENCNLNKFIIQTVYLEDLINMNCKGVVELLALDIEGIDAEVLLDINFNNINIKYISFEHLHLGDKDHSVKMHLNNSGFEYLGLGIDYNGYDSLYKKLSY